MEILILISFLTFERNIINCINLLIFVNIQYLKKKINHKRLYNNIYTIFKNNFIIRSYNLNVLKLIFNSVSPELENSI